jgi:tRNA1Val (adenine37-N6)-methyltransferase
MSSVPFKFKQFIVNQDKCAMKIGTDGVLLGAWASVSQNPLSILDIGAGTGVISLMLAQKCYAELIDAIEIDDDAYEQCTDNFENSSRSDRLFCYHASLSEFTDEVEDKYDLIVSNPPFYSEDYKSANNQRDTARFEEALPFEHLLESISILLAEKGIFTVIIPFKEEESFINLALKFGLFANRILRVKGNLTSEIKRSLIEFSFIKTEIQNSELIIETERHQYTQNYINLTKEFYLKM